ncbi:MAG: LL-diaminopimelate aminotransferase [Verrucomicrobia bacterium]|nr:LL-diaminopimelate aminotransferase [Verrucomicrobiota bacterium]
MKAVKESYKHFSKSYLFTEIEARVVKSGSLDLVSLGVGDVSLPLAPSVKNAIIEAVEEMGTRPIGYGPTDGYPFLKKALLETEYAPYNFTLEEISINDGISSAITTMTSLFPKDYKIGIIDPAYPAYQNAARLEEREITLLPCLEENGFIPQPPKEKLDIVYLCSPHNPTGTAMTKDDLQMWVDYARAHKAILFFDAAYHAFIQSPSVPTSIYACTGAKEVAIEFRSFSKSAGFTGLRLGYVVTPKELAISSFWRLRQDVYSNGFAYPVQKGALQALSPLGKEETRAQVESYLQGAKVLKETLEAKGFLVYGGEDIPFLWWKVGGDSWQAFDTLLHKYGLITVPGKGFGPSGEGFIRLSAFLSPAKLEKALSRLETVTQGVL